MAEEGLRVFAQIPISFVLKHPFYPYKDNGILQQSAERHLRRLVEDHAAWMAASPDQSSFEKLLYYVVGKFTSQFPLSEAECAEMVKYIAIAFDDLYFKRGWKRF